MERDKFAELVLWKENQGRKPLILRGARQTGKTWLLKELGKTHFREFVYINFEEASNTEFKGAFTEQYAMQQLRIDSNRYIGYWTNERSTSEVDFIVQDNGVIIPYEVKSGVNLRAKSFRLFCEKYTPESAVRTALTPYRKEDWMTNIPLYGI